jgi:hypothetical protein
MDDDDSPGMAVYLAAPTLRALRAAHENEFGTNSESIPLYVTVNRAVEALGN